ncbi:MULTISPECIES: hypothetical protein [Burkholderiaceae]|uniref:Uncharacterized protein n=1 Tax=Caballeronia sordidicola TaxID=196367 RepID=A0A242N2S4_CABSO|nr:MULTISPECIES: hypothetical protein [Burkholderiaceae]OTP77684.1 hypothetical protein PAMC26510_08425 [Caballeronia sordidicola]
MSIKNYTPFRQFASAYSAILAINQTIIKLPGLQRDALHDAMRGSEQALVGIKEALSSDGAESEVTALRARIEALENTFDERVAKAIRDHIFLPTTSHWSRDKPFMPFSSCSAADFLHPRYSDLCAVLDHPLMFHRKLWEWIFVLHHLEQAGMLQDGKQGVGFGVGKERLPAAFASRGASVLATDAPPYIGISSGWTKTGQHSDNLAELKYPSIVPDADFDARVSHRFCDMNAIDDDIAGFDFTWSCCCLEHLGSLEAGIQFILNSVEKTLADGGVAVHTTELNLSSNDDTIESGHTVLYRHRDLIDVVSRLRALGHDVKPFIIAPDSHVLDFHVDLPPYASSPHLKMRFDNYVTTSAGIVVRKSPH